jgi:hypothetical protein
MSWADAIANNILKVEIVMLAVQILGLYGLFRYVKETKAIRVAAEKQIKVSQDLLLVAMEQAEGIARPCITLASKLRPREEAIGEYNGVKGNSVVKAYKNEEGIECLALRNIGNGLALNITYRFNQVGSEWPKGLKGNDSYLQRLHAEKEIRLPLPVSMTKGQHWEAQFEFESLGARRYRTTVFLKASVLSDLRFEQISEPKHVISPAENSDKKPNGIS